MKLITKISIIVLIAFAMGSCTKYSPLEKVNQSSAETKSSQVDELYNGDKDNSITDPENEDEVEDIEATITDPENEDDIEEVN